MATPAGKGSDLRDRLTFPSFFDSPDEHDLDRRYLACDNVNAAWPRRHWCFLGEIVNVVPYGRLVIVVRDITGWELRVGCYDDRNGQKFAPMCRVGYTVAILYANRHNFLDGRPGFRVEQESDMTILPFSMQELLLANEMIFAPSNKTCGASGCKKRSGNICGSCRAIYYCSADCQKAEWAEHKKTCKAARVVRWFSERDWHTFDLQRGVSAGYWSFPNDFPQSQLKLARST